jgi:hypothetical protein
MRWAWVLLLVSSAWARPELSLRTDMSCGACHVDASGGGLRTRLGRVYERHALPMFDLLKPKPMQATPRRWAAGTDLRGALTVPLGGGLARSTASVFMRPYNPSQAGHGRLTALVQAGVGPDTSAPLLDRLAVERWWLQLHDLPLDLYARAGRFAPDQGWRTDDGTLVEAGPLLGAPLSTDRAVTGLELGVGRALYGRLSVFNATADRRAIWAPADGFAGAATVGWQGSGWMLGSSTVAGVQSGQWQWLQGLRWGVSLARWGAPVRYLGELQWAQAQGPGDGLGALHEVVWVPVKGLDAFSRYHWRDPSTHHAFDTEHRADLGLRWRILAGLQLRGQYEHRWRNTEDRFSAAEDVLRLELQASH